ncbi:hypothetical protein PITCH_A190118 [uncultured Desulfobacterium sp.]|uniref:Uncharacterized protein n=1 Tax=uncultured Desulfobacterium sp. TaxID=201089 RepID=A0A445MVX7_9BACT|nr:hypothetical protein PITCH_A190118 [uncultured Desulfobacterium sp.]
MSERITVERIKSISIKLDVYKEGMAIDELMDKLLDRIEQLATEQGHKWRSNNEEVVRFYNDAVEEMELMLEYEGLFF